MALASKLLSGIEFSQTVATAKTALSATFLYQQFYLPTDIERGTRANEVRVPDLTGFAVLLDVADGAQDTVIVTWVFQREIFGVGWVTVTNGTTMGAQSDGDKVWFDIYFPSMIPVDPAATSDKFRIGITGTVDTSVWHGVSPESIPAIGNEALAFRVLTASGDRGVDFLGNQYRNSIFTHSIDNVSTDAEADIYWYSKPNPSRFAIENLYFDISEVGNDAVIDSVLIDPITPDVYFHIYYSSEGEPASDAAGWDGKLWERVPKTFQARSRETHVLPTPISTRYIKIEFSHLQARPYNPGTFQQPIRYQKYPKWVLDYFLGRIELDSENRFVSSRTEVRYSALDLAYNYYLDDLKQEPDRPAVISPIQGDTVRAFLQARTDVSDQIDAAMAARINTVLAPYARGLRGLLGDGALQALELSYTTPAITTVSSLNRDAVVFEQAYPVMFFHLSARHRYREVSASLSHERAYFVGIRQVAFLRERYTSTTDTNLYVEIGGDSLNLSRNDFVRDNNRLVISSG